MATESDILRLLADQGPLTGAELLERAGGDPLPLWRTCRQSPAVLLHPMGHRYLRLDRAVTGYARLSPSIRREFLTYTVVGRAADESAIRTRAGRLRRQIAEISRRKRRLAHESLISALETFPGRDTLLREACAILAGDAVYDMAHAVPRPEPSTDRMVRGSDLDVVIVTRDHLAPDLLRAADDAIYRKKYYLLVHPDYGEELDYLIKPLSKVREQVRFDTFESMVACKILDEGVLLWGSEDIYRAVKRLLAEHSVPDKLAEMTVRARTEREQAERRLLEQKPDESEAELLHLFYTTEEKEEIY